MDKIEKQSGIKASPLQVNGELLAPGGCEGNLQFFFMAE